MNTMKIDSAAELLAHACQMELEAEERYQYLAEQMDVHNNPDLANLFRELSREEGRHASEIRGRIEEMGGPDTVLQDYKWPGFESPETVDLGAMHYMMTPRQALLLALRAEENAFSFFSHLLEVATDEDVKRFAAEFAEEEKHHVEMVHRELEKYPDTGRPARDDMDMPNEPY